MLIMQIEPLVIFFSKDAVTAFDKGSLFGVG